MTNPTVKCDECDSIVELMRRDGSLVLTCDCPKTREVTNGIIPEKWQ